MMSQHLPTALCTALLSLSLAFSAAAMPTTDLDQVALRERVAALEARLAALEADRPIDDVGAEGVPLLDRLAGVEARLGRLEQWLLRQPAPQVAQLGGITGIEAGAASQVIAGEEIPNAEVAATSHAGPESARSIHSRNLFLPSRGAAGGALHYGDPGSARIDLHAFLDLEYIDSGNDGARGGVSTFDNHHANLFVRARLRENLLGHIEIEYEHSGTTVEIDQAFLSWTVTDTFTLDAGRFYTPFGIERFVWYSPTNALVSRPLALRQIVPGNFYANGLRASGIVATNGSDRFIYEASLSDGLGDDALTNRRGSRQDRDNNSSRALSGRIAYAFWPRFEVGTSYHHQRYATDESLDLTFFGLDFAARFSGFELRAEYIDASLERSGFTVEGEPLRLPDLEQDGWYAQLAYAFDWDRTFFPELKVVGRLDRLDLDRTVVGNDDRDAFSLGLNALFYDHFRIKAEFQFVDEDGPDREDDTFSLQFVIDY